MNRKLRSALAGIAATSAFAGGALVTASPAQAASVEYGPFVHGKNSTTGAVRSGGNMMQISGSIWNRSNSRVTLYYRVKYTTSGGYKKWGDTRGLGSSTSYHEFYQKDTFFTNAIRSRYARANYQVKICSSTCGKWHTLPGVSI